MNFHVVVVHFPIALLTIYCLLELIRSSRITALPYWFYLKSSLVIAGALAAVAARQTGLWIQPRFSVPPVATIVATHRQWGAATVIIFGVIALLYVLAWFKKASPGKPLHPILEKMARWTNHPAMAIFALAGLLAVTVTGTLGGIIAFGPDIDPLTRWLYDFYGFGQ